MAFRSGSSLAYGSRTTSSFTAPAGIANDDILVCSLNYGGFSVPAAPTAPSGWALWDVANEVTGGGGWIVREYFYWKRASGESGNYDWTHSSANTYGYLAAYSGRITTGTPLSATSRNSSTTGTSGVGTGITVAADSDLIFTSTDPTGSVRTPPSGMTERYDADGYWSDEVRSSAGATGDRTQTNGGTGWITRMVEVLVVAATPWPPDGTSDAASKLKVITTGLRW
jgi:hypothetical protein